MRVERQWQIILEMIAAYGLNEPLSRFLKNYFRSHKQMGSNDRRQASAFIYNYFRARNAFPELETGGQVAFANFLCCKESTPLLEYCAGKYSLPVPGAISKPVEEKILLLQTGTPGLSGEKIFPFRQLISDRVDVPAFIRSFFEQPLLWIRVRKKYRNDVLDELSKMNIPFSEHDGDALSLPNRTKLENLVSWKEGYFEVQDLASQRSLAEVYPKPKETWWDACAASGGKSLALIEKESRLKLTVTDVRKSVLENLKKRFQRAGISGYELMEYNLANAETRVFPFDRRFDGIIADVPCTGSGTWARTPEWLSMFKPEDLPRFTEGQKSIVRNCSKYLKQGGTLVYITCSVFAMENENNVSFIQKELNLEKVNEQYIQCTAEHADTMFVAVFRKVF